MWILYYDHGNGAVERNHRPDPRCRQRPPVEFIAATPLPHFPSRNSVIVKYCDENAAFFVPAWINKFESCEWTDVEKHVLFPFSFFFFYDATMEKFQFWLKSFRIWIIVMIQQSISAKTIFINRLIYYTIEHIYYS